MSTFEHAYAHQRPSANLVENSAVMARQVLDPRTACSKQQIICVCIYSCPFCLLHVNSLTPTYAHVSLVIERAEQSAPRIPARWRRRSQQARARWI